MAQPCSSGTSRPAAALGHASSVHLSSFLGYVLRDRRQADPAGLHALIQAGHLRGRGIPQCGAATLHIGVCGGSTVQPGVAPSCFRHLRHISPPGPMQEMPHVPHTCTLGLITVHLCAPLSTVARALLTAPCLAWAGYTVPAAIRSAATLLPGWLAVSIWQFRSCHQEAQGYPHGASGVVGGTPSAPHAVTSSHPPLQEPTVQTPARAQLGKHRRLPSRELDILVYIR
ncbi:hypothetical protein CGC21_19935 [Leishmania donovani]|uniref:Uncharacterized protein n=1 Tax=Leishmania donovani TaxID=5661 RepID=A0A504X6T5_LEIDO|nr:hypothetical protein CGC21_19935 [Leishmania donovani]